MPIRNNLSRIFSEIGHRAALVVAVKHATLGQILEARQAGATNLGFNTLKQMEEVAPHLPENTKLHFIGALQKNKAKKVVKLCPELIQSVDSYPLAEKINDAAEKMGKTQDILIQVKTDQKKETGIPPEELDNLMNRISRLENIGIKGLMTVPPNSENPEESRPYFRKMKSLLETSNLKILSMGMSKDYRIAIEEGSTMIRIGTGIFR